MDDFEIEIVPRNNRSIKKTNNTKIVNIKLNPEQSKKTSRKKPKKAQQKQEKQQQSRKKEIKSLTKTESKTLTKKENNNKNIKKECNTKTEITDEPIKVENKNRTKKSNKKKGKENQKPPVIVKVIKSDSNKENSIKESNNKNNYLEKKTNNNSHMIKKTPEYLLKTRRVSSRKKTPPRKLSPNNPKRRLSPRTIQKLKLKQQRQYLINEKIRSLKEKQKLLQKKMMSTNPVEEYFNKKHRSNKIGLHKKKLTPPRKVIHINPDYNINTINKPNKKSNNTNINTNSKQELLIKRKKLLEARKKLLTKKKGGHNNSRDYNKHNNFNYPIKSPLVQSLEYKRERLKNQRQKELEKISHKKKAILSLNTQKQEMKLLEEIKKEELIIKKLQNEQLKLDKMHFLYKQKLKKGFNQKSKSNQKQKKIVSTNKNVNIVKPKISSPKKERLYSLDGILLSSINKSQKKSAKHEKYKINDLSQIEEFLTDYDEVIWEEEPHLINNKNSNFNNLIIENINDLDDLIEMNSLENNTDNNIQKIKSELENKKIFNNTNKLTDDMCKIIYSSISDLINLEKIN